MSERWDGITLERAKALLSEYADEIKVLREENVSLRADCSEMAAEIRASTLRFQLAGVGETAA